eukprot:12926181-Prorocentrum_lima.AAC.1
MAAWLASHAHRLDQQSCVVLDGWVFARSVYQLAICVFEADPPGRPLQFAGSAAPATPQPLGTTWQMELANLPE